MTTSINIAMTATIRCVRKFASTLSLVLHWFVTVQFCRVPQFSGSRRGRACDADQCARRAAIMDVSGQRSVMHVPSWCRHITCMFKDKCVCANFVLCLKISTHSRCPLDSPSSWCQPRFVPRIQSPSFVPSRAL